MNHGQEKETPGTIRKGAQGSAEEVSARRVQAPLHFPEAPFDTSFSRAIIGSFVNAILTGILLLIMLKFYSVIVGANVWETPTIEAAIAKGYEESAKLVQEQGLTHLTFTVREVREDLWTLTADAVSS